jgi:LmbE family N-acetylglucosaminyl deacetylase
VVRAEARRAHEILGVRQTIFKEIPAAMVSEQAVWSLNRLTLDVVDRVRPDVLYVPFLNDLHKDHRELVHSFSVAWRPSTEAGRGIREILAYETVSETHWNMPFVEQSFSPNVWVDISQFLEKKLDALRCYQSQLRPFPDARSLEAVEALARWRGSQMGLRAAESFITIRRVW